MLDTFNFDTISFIIGVIVGVVGVAIVATILYHYPSSYIYYDDYR